MFKPYEADLV